MSRRTNVDGAKVVKVLQVQSLFGSGTEEDPCRTVVEYFNLKGERIALIDPCNLPAGKASR